MIAPYINWPGCNAPANWIGQAMPIRTALLGLLLGSTVLALSACNTVRGLGEDLESAADAGEEAIN